MLNAEARDELRDRAVRAWAEAKRLSALADGLGDNARRLRVDAGLHRSTARSRRAGAVAQVDRVVHEVAGAVGPTVGGVGLVAAGRPERVGCIQDAMQRRLSRVWTARDPVTAVALAIATQPDVALVVDGELRAMDGLETSVLIRSYAPRSEVVLLTGDDRTGAAARRERILVGDPEAGLDELLATIGLVA